MTHSYAKDKLTFASTPVKEYCVEGSIVDLEGRIDPSKFLGIHRSTLVNIDRIAEMYKTELTVARERVKELRERLNL